MIPTMYTPGPPIARRDVIIAAVVTVIGVGALGWLQGDDVAGVPPGAHPAFGLLFALVTVPLLWRRRAPLLAVGASLAGMAIHVIGFGYYTRCGIALPVAFLEVYACAAYLPRLPALLGLVGSLATSVIMLSDDASAGWDGLTVAVPVTLAVFAIGLVVRSRSGLVSRLQTRTSELRTARDERAALEVATDRVRLSTELDDLLRRRLADLARRADAGAGADAGAALATIETESRATLEEMRAVVGDLRGDDGSAPTTPQPTLTGLDALLVHAKGTDARLQVEGSPRVLPAGLELSAYRVVEHLLAALEDDPDVAVGVRFGDDALELTVTGPARKRADASIRRARERVALHDGRLDARVRDGRATLHAAFPVLATV